MELYARRYTTPFLLDIAIKNNNLAEFVTEIINANNEQMLWETYNAHQLALHGIDFDKFKISVADSSTVTETPVEETIVKNKKLLMNFNPEKKVGEVL